MNLQTQHTSSSRRFVLKSLIASLAMPLLCHPTLASANQDILPINMTYEHFVQYSKMITKSEYLDETMSKKVFQLINIEPWGMSHLIRINNKFSNATNQQSILSSLDTGEHWFLGHFLTIWITGIYYHETGDQVVSYQNALMFTSLKGIRPTPGLSTEKFGFWSHPPANKVNG